MTTSKGYAVAYLREVDFGAAITEYLQRIDATMAPYDGRFLVHGGRQDPLEGEWGGDVVMLEFPDLATARAWYDSPGYQQILPLRTEHSRSVVILLEGVSDDYHAASKIPVLQRLHGLPVTG